MRFKTPCFIRKNTPELRKKLEELGYTLSSLMHRDTLLTSHQMAQTISSDITDSIEAVDCGTNEQLFLSIAALRDDTDKYQYFYAVEDGVARLCKSDRFEEECSMHELYHKMTVEELINHFKEG